MGKRQRDCSDCGASVGYLGREYCCRCTRRLREQAGKARCPGCGRDRVLIPDTGQCVLCSRRCVECGGPIRFRDESVCRPCRKRAALAAAKSPCPRCGKPGHLREATGWCGWCSRPGPPKDPPRVCVSCGELRRHVAHGLCGRCWQCHPDRPFVRGETLAARLAEPPDWLDDFVAYLAAHHCSARACVLITTLARLLEDEHPSHPQCVLERARRPGRSMGSLARALETFFTGRGLAIATDQADRLAAGRRQKRIEATPAALRAAVAAFEESMLHARERARRAGTRPRKDRTIESALATVRDLARFLEAQRNKMDWALVDITDVEAFLAELPNNRARRLTVLGQFFRFARGRRLLLIDPTSGVSAQRHRGFRGRTLMIGQQRALFRRWSADPAAHPHEALLGLLAMLHGASNSEVRGLQVDHIDDGDRSVRLGKRPHPVPLDPVSWAALQRCLHHRNSLRTDNRYVLVTRGTKADQRPASEAYLTHLLDPCGLPPKMLRTTRLADLVNTMDPKLVAEAFGMRPEGAMIYLADHVDQERLPEQI
jgi:site-specific recombinase XerD